MAGGDSNRNDSNETSTKKDIAVPKEEAKTTSTEMNPPTKSDSDSDDLPPLSARTKKKFDSSTSSAFDALMGKGGTNSKGAPSKRAAVASKAKSKKKKDSEDDFDDFLDSVKKKTSRKAESDSDFDADPKPKSSTKKNPAALPEADDSPLKKPPKRARKKMYFDSDEDQDDFDNDSDF